LSRRGGGRRRGDRTRPGSTGILHGEEEEERSVDEVDEEIHALIIQLLTQSPQRTPKTERTNGWWVKSEVLNRDTGRGEKCERRRDSTKREEHEHTNHHHTHLASLCRNGTCTSSKEGEKIFTSAVILRTEIAGDGMNSKLI
jgi:hypothetical protein